MAYPNPPEISTSYTAQEQALGDGTLPGQELDVDLAAVRASITSLIEFVKGITRSDGALANGIVTRESLGSALIIGFDPPAQWMTGTSYTTSSTVFEGFGFYLCTVAHTSGTFATDLASSRWVLLADLTPPGGALIAANNLNDVPDKPNARVNLGLGTMATAAATSYRTNVENEAFFQPWAAALTAWAGVTRSAGFDAFVANPTSANLRALLTDETGTGAALFAGGAMGTPASLVLTNATGLTTAGVAAATLVTAAETIGSNNNDTTIPTSAAVYAVSGRVLLASKTASASATLDFTEFNNAAYRYYEFELENVKPVTDGAGIWIRTSTDGGATYDFAAASYQWVYGGTVSGGASDTGNAADTFIAFGPGQGNAAAERGVTGSLKVYHAGNSGENTRIVGLAMGSTTVSSGQVFTVSGVRLADQDTDAMRFLMSAGNIASGVIRMYGVLK